MANKIINSFDVWITAQGLKSKGRLRSVDNISLEGIARLRELILELAIRGKLVSQDPNDEPARALLKKMAKEEEKLVREKVIKKPKELPLISNDELLFELPKGWEFTRLNNVGEWGAGATPLRGRHEYYGGNIPWFKSGELSSDFISQSEETVTELALKETSLRYNKIGDVLIAMYGATIGKASILQVPATTNQAVCACTPFAGINNVFLLLLLKAYNKRFNDMGAGGAQPNISREKIIATVIPLPPTNEQQRIVTKVNELMALCDGLENQETDHLKSRQLLVETLLGTLTQAQDPAEFQTAWSRLAQHFDDIFATEDSIDQLKQTILQLAVMGKLVPQDPNDEPASALLKRIEKERNRLIAEKKLGKQGVVPKISDEKKGPELPRGWEYARFGDVVYNRDAERVPLSVDERSSRKGVYDYYGASGVIDQIDDYLFDKPLLLIGEDGANLINRTTPIAFMARGKFWVNNHAHVIDGLSEQLLLFLSLHINAISLESYITGTAQPKMNQAKMNSIVLAVPPLAEQSRIIKKVDVLFDMCDRLKERVVELQRVANQMANSIIEQVG